MFLRTKRVKNRKYCYIVKNEWTDEGPRQKVKKYLGRAHTFTVEKEEDFFEFYDIIDVDTYAVKKERAIIYDLVKWELYKHGFDEKNGKMEKEGITQRKTKILSNKKSIVLSINDGHLCEYTMNRVIRFVATREEEGAKLAKYFVEAGIKIPPELFVKYFEKVFKEAQKEEEE